MAVAGVNPQDIAALRLKLTKFANKARAETVNKVVVGYSAPYAIYVHENVEMKLRGQPRPSGRGVYWGPHGQAKFLEEPSRVLRPAIAARIAAVTKSTKSLQRGLYSGGVLLRNASQLLVPIEYKVLHDSAFIKVLAK